MFYISLLFASFLLSFLLSLAIRRLSARAGFVDNALFDPERKKHLSPIPLLGGIAPFLIFFLGIIFLIQFSENLLSSYWLKNIVGIFFSATIIMIGGFFDDAKWIQKRKILFLFPMVAVIMVIASGVGIEFITSPFGGVLDLTQYTIPLFWFHGALFKITILSDLFTFFWLLGMSYTTKILDGLDGLVSGITVIGSGILLLFSLSQKYFDPTLATLATLLLGSFLGFLILNWHPAKIFLGEGGSLLAGFLLGVFAILSSSKIAVTLLVMGIPIVDLLIVIFWRRVLEKKSPFKTADRKHFHFRLIDSWHLSVRKAVFFYWTLAFIFGITILLFQVNFFRGEFISLKIGETYIQAEVVRYADDMARGLGGRKKLSGDEGMLFVYPHETIPKFWMKNMNFPIDILWIRNGKIVDFSENIPVEPIGEKLPIYSPNAPITNVLEVNAGFVKKNSIQKGDQVDKLAGMR